MRRPILTITLASSLLFITGSAGAEPFIPKMNLPESYKDFRFGLDEMRKNIETVQCGGWEPDSYARVYKDDGEPGCKVEFECRGGINSCGGTTGRAELKEPDGTIPLCFSDYDATGGLSEYLLIHELVHARQICALEPGEDLIRTQADCCNVERQAYTAQCQAEAADGQFDVQYGGITVDVESCIMFGLNNVSCAGWGPNACGNYDFPPGFADAYLQAVATAPRYDCNDATTNLPPRAQAIMDDINAISDAQKMKVEGDVPIPEISPDIPGRSNVDPLGAPISGVGERGNFEYPDSAWGYTSACNSGDYRIHDDDLAALGVDIIFDDVDLNDNPNVRVVEGGGTIDVNPYHWCRRENDMEKATPQWCKKLYETWLTIASIAPRPAIGDPLCPTPKQYCFDYTEECRGQGCRTVNDPSFSQTPPECHLDADVLVIDQPERVEIQQSSFYRHYAQGYLMPAINVEGGGKTWQVRAECYEYYKEEDPKNYVTSKEDEQCEFVIATPDEQNPDNPEWPSKQDQKKPQARGSGPVVAADTSAVEEPDRDSRDLPEPWVADEETNLNLIDMERLKELQEDFEDPSDISYILGALLPTKQRASKTVPKNARADAVDDSDDRAFVTYWEKQERELMKMTADQRTQLIMPARFLVGIDDNDPLFQYVTHKIVRPEGVVELTLRAGPEDLRSVVLSLQRMFIAPLQEVRIPVLVPLASETEINALIFQWEQWKKYEDQDATRLSRSSHAGDADDLIQKLREYRNRIVEVRRMRGALANQVQRMYDGQQEIREYFARWFKDQTDQFTLAIEHAEQRRELRRIWRLLQRSLLQADACQMYWCSNHRYSAPIYSLLDEWWGENEPGDGRDESYDLSKDSRFDPPLDLEALGYVQPEDNVFDFSDMKFPRDPLLLPVLWPVQVKIRLPSPPDIGGIPPSVDDFPDLLDIPDEDVFDSFDIPEVDLDSAPSVSLPSTPDLEDAKNILREIRKIVDGTEIADQMAQEEALKNGDSIDQGDLPAPDEVLGRENMMHTYCRFQPSIVIPPDPDGKKGDPMKIIHVENDLRERLARLFSRWMPERMEDYAGRVARLKSQYPDADSQPSCHEDVLCYLLPPEKTTMNTWQWFMPDPDNGAFDRFAEELRDMTLPEDEDENPYKDAQQSYLERLFPKIDLPLEYQLYPDPPTP